MANKKHELSASQKVYCIAVVGGKKGKLAHPDRSRQLKRLFNHAFRRNAQFLFVRRSMNNKTFVVDMHRITQRIVTTPSGMQIGEFILREGSFHEYTDYDTAIAKAMTIAAMRG